MRTAFALAALVCCLVPLGAAAAPPPASVEIAAQSVALYTDRRVVIADAGVAVATGARTFGASHAVFFLQTGRLVMSGGVTEKDGATTRSGEAYALDVGTGDGAFVAPGDSGTSGGALPALTSQRVVVRPGISLTFTPAQVGNGAAAQTVASYVYPLAAPHARDFGPSPALGAALEFPVPLTAGRNAYAFATPLYDRYLGGFGLGLEAHVAASDRGYAALALTQNGDGARYDLLAFQTVRDGLNQTLSASSGRDLRYVRYALTSFGRAGTLQASLEQNGATQADDVYASTDRRMLGGGFAIRFDGDLGRDVHPADFPVATDGRASLGAVLDGPALRVAGATLSTQALAAETAYSYGRRAFDGGVSAFASRSFGALLASAGAALLQRNDRIGIDPRQTYRTYTLAAGYAPHAPWSLFASVQYARDHPQYAGYGRPEFLQTVALRIRRKHGPGIELDTSFAYGRRGAMPRPTLSFSLLR